MRRLASAMRRGSSGSRGAGRAVSTAQNPQRRVQRVPAIMKVAVGREKHSPMFGQRASSQTVRTPTSRSTRRSGRASRRIPRFFAAQAGSRVPDGDGITARSEPDAERPERGHEFLVGAVRLKGVVVAGVRADDQLHEWVLVAAVVIQLEDGAFDTEPRLDPEGVLIVVADQGAAVEVDVVETREVIPLELKKAVRTHQILGREKVETRTHADDEILLCLVRVADESRTGERVERVLVVVEAVRELQHEIQKIEHLVSGGDAVRAAVVLLVAKLADGDQR